MMEVEKEMNQTAAQVRAYENEIFTLKRNSKKNELTLKELENVKENRGIFVPLGKAYPITITQLPVKDSRSNQDLPGLSQRKNGGRD